MNKTKTLLISTLFLGFLGAGMAGEVLYVPPTAPFMKGLRVRQNIKSECALEQRIADDVAHRANNAYDKVVREKPSGKYHVLTMEIIDVFGAGGGAWSGPKNVEVKGTLKDQKGRIIGSFNARRYSMGGPLGGLKGTCGILRRISKALGNDIAIFLADPDTGATLGD